MVRTADTQLITNACHHIDYTVFNPQQVIGLVPRPLPDFISQLGISLDEQQNITRSFALVVMYK